MKMFGKSWSRDRSGRVAKRTAKGSGSGSFREKDSRRLLEKVDVPVDNTIPRGNVVSISVGPDERLFAAHEEVLARSPILAELCRDYFLDSHPLGRLSDPTQQSSSSPMLPHRSINLPYEHPEVFSCVLEFLYKGDYYPRLLSDRSKGTWYLEDNKSGNVNSSTGMLCVGTNPKSSPALTCSSANTNGGSPAFSSPYQCHRASPKTNGRTRGGITVTPFDSPASAATKGTTCSSLCPCRANKRVSTTSTPSVTLIHAMASGNGEILRDTAVYCTAHRYGLEDLKRLALRKQGLLSGVEVTTILRSMRFAYDNTPESDSRLRAHYLALIIRCRNTFKRSGTMQAEMGNGGSTMFFDLFVAMCNHIDDLVAEITGLRQQLDMG